MTTPSATPVADALGLGVQVEYKGKVYDLAPVDHPEVVARYQDHLRRRSLQEVDYTRQLLGPMAGELAMDSHQRLGVSGMFDFGSTLWLDSVKAQVNQKAILLHAMRAKDRSVTPALVEEVYRACPDQVARLLYGDPAPAGPDEGNG